ncbi:putative YT521-B-like splicing factor [Aspergillus undulatus]|uniref:putative YT521-B-like splicing factor n=1 Tax=Aspergillus undulatus TaxID=1810928 RepID=UPI003CCCD30D
MDGGTPQNRPKAAREAKGKSRAPKEPGKSGDTGGAHRQTSKSPCYFVTDDSLLRAQERSTLRPEPASFRQTENVQHYPITPTGSYGHPPSVLGMGNMAAALPSYPAGPMQLDQQNMQQQQFVPVALSPGLVYGMPQFQTFPAPTANPNMMYSHPYPQVYMPYVQQQQHTGARHPDTAGFSPIAPTTPSPGTIQNPMGVYGQSYFHPNMYAAQGHLSGLTSPQAHNRPHSSIPRTNEGRQRDDKRPITIVDGSTHMRPSAAQGSSADPTSRPSKSNTPKRPPRKPKQSGNALWVGNLAPGTNIVELKDHFSQGATKDLESVFLISRSNCAFVNYKTEEACIKALSRFHDTRLRGARLVCRVRRGLMSPGPHSELTGLSQTDQPSIKEAEEMLKSTGTEDEGREASYSTRVPNRYFILKSLAIEDLEISRKSGIWATQTHNEESLNRAFENADNVYLIFSANKSGEYYGYSRMMTSIKEDESLSLEMPPRPEHDPSNEPDSPDVTPTPASTSAPNGRIINDIARGTIFWEADTSEDEDGRPQKSAYQAPEEPQQQTTAELQLIGKPFRIRWLSTERVPFHRTRGLRNAWNSNRECKIARDGTELEFSVGEKLVLLFHSEASG